MARRATPVLAMLGVAVPAQAGLVFREVEIADNGASAAGTMRVIRRVFADGESCKVVFEDSGDPQTPAGTYILATVDDAFLIDAARRTVAPVDPTDMRPVTQSPREPGRLAATVAIEVEVDEPGPPMLGLPTRHYVYRLRIRAEAPEDAGGALETRAEERHEFWAAAVPEGEEQPVAWQALRAADDAGRSAAPRETRAALEAVYRHGLVLRQIVERHGPGAPLQPGGPDTERIGREVTELSRENIPSEMFKKPAGLIPTEILAPVPEEN
jgi:hypothetical protein